MMVGMKILRSVRAGLRRAGTAAWAAWLSVFGKRRGPDDG